MGREWTGGASTYLGGAGLLSVLRLVFLLHPFIVWASWIGLEIKF